MPLVSATACLFAIGVWRRFVGVIVALARRPDERIARVHDLTGEPFPPELLLRLKHMIISHHGELAFGSPKVPMTPEAVALHHLDNLDAKIHQFTREIREDGNASSSWTQFNTSLQRRIFKGGGRTGGTGYGE